MTDELNYTATANFEAARRLLSQAGGDRSKQLHGHSFLVKICCKLPDNFASFSGNEVESLQQLLSSIVSPLNYSDLNQFLEDPTNENLARWIHSRLKISFIQNVSVQSTLYEGLDLDKNKEAHLWRRYVLHSAHQLPHVSPQHKCGRMHGHGFEVILHANTSVNAQTSWINYAYIDTLWDPIFQELDHQCLNDIPGLENPTSENISAWIWRRLKPQLPELSLITVHETTSCGAYFDGLRYCIWKEMSIDSALRLKFAPVHDKRHRIHGHTYTLKLHLHAPLDTVRGWVVDFGDVKELFNPVFESLDHQPLHQIPELDDCDVATLARWIKIHANAYLPEINQIDLYENNGGGVILRIAER